MERFRPGGGPPNAIFRVWEPLAAVGTHVPCGGQEAVQGRRDFRPALGGRLRPGFDGGVRHPSPRVGFVRRWAVGNRSAHEPTVPHAQTDGPRLRIARRGKRQRIPPEPPPLFALGCTRTPDEPPLAEECQVGSGKWQVAREQSPAAGPPGLPTSDFTLHASAVRNEANLGRPDQDGRGRAKTPAETSPGLIASNEPNLPCTGRKLCCRWGQAYQTKPISRRRAGKGQGREGRPYRHGRAETCETKPIPSQRHGG